MTTSNRIRLAGVAELADLLSVRRTTISQWHSRQLQNDFPNPIEDLAMGPVWDLEEVVEWYRNYRPLRNMRKVGSLPEEFQVDVGVAVEDEPVVTPVEGPAECQAYDHLPVVLPSWRTWSL